MIFDKIRTLILRKFSIFLNKILEKNNLNIIENQKNIRDHCINILDEKNNDLYNKINHTLKKHNKIINEKINYIVSIQNKIIELQYKISEERIESVHHHIHNIKQTLNLISRKSITSVKIRVIFLVHHIEAWDSLVDLYYSMVEADDFEPIVISIHRRFPGQASFSHENIIHEKLEKENIPHLRFSMQESFEGLEILKSLRPDIIFRQSQWENDIPPAFTTPEIGFARLCYVPYAILDPIDPPHHISGIFADTLWYRMCWKIFYATPLEIERARKTSTLKTENIECTGHPKVSRLINQGQKNCYWPISQNDNYKIIWAPHHSIGKDWFNFGMFHLVYREILQIVQNDPSLDIILAPHPALFTQLTHGDTPLLSQEELDTFLEEWKELPNTGIHLNGNYAGIMQASDLLMTDGISFLAEYQFFNKPLIFLERPDHMSFNETGQRILKGLHPVSTLAEAHALIERFRQGEADPCHPHQTALTEWLSEHGNACHNILNAIRKGLEKENTLALSDTMPHQQ